VDGRWSAQSDCPEGLARFPSQDACRGPSGEARLGPASAPRVRSEHRPAPHLGGAGQRRSLASTGLAGRGGSPQRSRVVSHDHHHARGRSAGEGVAPARRGLRPLAAARGASPGALRSDGAPRAPDRLRVGLEGLELRGSPQRRAQRLRDARRPGWSAVRSRDRPPHGRGREAGDDAAFTPCR